MSSDRKKELSEFIKSKASEIGFSACGISISEILTEPLKIFKEWLEGGNQASMKFLEVDPEKRMDPTVILEGSKSVISLLYKYKPDEDLVPKDTYKIARYALGTDYHIVMKQKMELLVSEISNVYGPFNYRVFVDSAPVAEKSWAVRSGLGWIGKNSLLINRTLGSYVFIGEIISDLELRPDEKTNFGSCGNCNKCMESCPTSAIFEPGRIDARKCLVYYTIETKTVIPEEIRPFLNNRIYGCDICQEVCPFNIQVDYQHNSWLEPKDIFTKMSKDDWKNLTQDQFTTLFSNSGIKRLTYAGLMNKIKSFQ